MKLGGVILVKTTGYLKDRRLLFMVLMAFQLTSPNLVRAEQPIAVFSEELSKGLELKVKFEGDSYWAQEKTKGWVLLKSGVLRRGDSKPVLFLDVDGDGVKDLFLKLFDSGASDAYALFFAKLQNGNTLYFSESKEVFGAPYLNEKGNLISIKRNGPLSIIEKYKIGRDGLYRYELREPINSDVEKVTILNESGKAKTSINYIGADETASACILPERAYLSSTPFIAGQKKSYLVKGDIILILDSDRDGEWFRVRFQGKTTTDAWVPQAVLDFNDSDSCNEK